MKNSIISVILALFLSISFAYAIVSVQETNGINFNATDDSALTVLYANSTSQIISLSGLDATISGTSYKLNISADPSQFTVFGNGSRSITLSAPTNDVQAGKYTAQILVTSNQTGQIASIPVEVVVPALEVDSIEVDDDSLEKGQKFTVTVKYKNVADITDVEDIKVTIKVYEGDENDLDKIAENLDGDKLEDDKDISGTVRHDSEKEVSFDFEFPFDVSDDDTFTIFVKVEGQSTKNSAIKFVATDVEEITASVPDSKIEISKLTAQPSSLQCGVSSVKISTEVRNIGDSTQDVQLFLRNPVTGFEKIMNDGEDLYLDNDYSDEDQFTEDVDEFVSLTDIKSGANTYQLVAYYDDGDSTETKDVVITQQSCSADTTQDTTNDDSSNDVIVTTPTQPTTPSTPTYPTTTPTVTLKDVSGYSGFDGGVLIPVVIGALGLIIGVLVALLFARR